MKKMVPLENEENKSYRKEKVSHIFKKEFISDDNKKIEFKKYYKVRDHCYFTGKYRGALM